MTCDSSVPDETMSDRDLQVWKEMGMKEADLSITDPSKCVLRDLGCRLAGYCLEGLTPCMNTDSVQELGGSLLQLVELKHGPTLRDRADDAQTRQRQANAKQDIERAEELWTDNVFSLLEMSAPYLHYMHLSRCDCICGTPQFSPQTALGHFKQYSGEGSV